MKRVLILAVLRILLLPATIRAQVNVAVAPVVHQIFLSTSGIPLASGCITTTQSGTSTPLATYQDSLGITANSNPIILGADGGADIWLTNNAYRFKVVAYDGIPGNGCAAGVQQYLRDGINPWNIINLPANLFLSGNTSDPSGTAGEMTYRSDIPCLRFFTTFWDCVVRLTDTQTLTNKTLTAPTITTPTVTGGTYANPILNGVNAQTGVTYTIASTDEQKLVTLSNSAAVAVTLPIATTAGFGAGTVFHVRNLGAGAVTITPTTSTIDGVASLILTTGQGLDIYSDGINYETQKGAATSVSQADQTGLTANVAATQIGPTPAANGFYRFSCFTVDTQAATTSSTLPSCAFTFTEADTNLVAASLPTCATVTTNQVGDSCTLTGVAFMNYFFVKGGVPIKYFTSSYASSGATSLAYAVHVRIEGPF